MEYERTSMAQFAEIQRLIQEGFGDRKIARSLHCRRTLVAAVRAGEITEEMLNRSKQIENKCPPAWVLKVNWTAVEKDISGGFQLKRIWEDSAEELTSHSNFFKYVKVRFRHLLSETVTLREFNPGEYCEVDYAGDKIEWIDLQTGEVHEAHVFVGILCFSQKIFAHAAEDEKKPNWLESHRRMFNFYGGTTRVIVPDQLKNGVIKTHLYDPDLNPDYVELAKHYGIAVVPARRKHPRDKALVENGVGILMRYFKFIYRRRTFTSLEEVQKALQEAVNKINGKIHTRFKVSREERFESLEKSHLKALPVESFELGEWKTALIHPDCTIASPDKNFYSAPHIYRGKEVRVKMTYRHVEIFLDLDRIAVHQRARGKIGERIVNPAHVPENSRAYLEATPQMILSQARFSCGELYNFIDDLFKEDTLGHLRRALGLVRKTYAVIQAHGRETATPWITAAVAHMRRFNRIKVQAFEEVVKAEMKKMTLAPGTDRTIVRKPGNPMVRGHGTRETSVNAVNVPPQLQLV
jgi:transposase